MEVEVEIENEGEKEIHLTVDYCTDIEGGVGASNGVVV